MQTQTQTEEKQSEVTQAEKVEPIAIYKNNIFVLVDDLKQDNQFQGLTDEELKNNKAFFPRLIQYIYNNYIGDLLGNKLGRGHKVIYPDISILNNLFSIYLELTTRYKWNNKPSLLEFSILTGISRNTFYEWLKGDYTSLYNINNTNDSNNNINESMDNTPNEDKRRHLTSDYKDAVQKWEEICEQSLLDGSDTIRDIFLLKSLYKYRDNNNVIEINHNVKQIISADNLPSLIDLKSNN